MQLLLKYGENPNQHQEYTPLILAIEEGDVSTTNLLLNVGANVNVVNKDKKTCFISYSQEILIQVSYIFNVFDLLFFSVP